MKYKSFFFFVIYFFVSCFIIAQNPVIKGMGVSDPHVRVFNDTIYLYSGHDTSPDDTTWVMKDWRVFWSTDLVNWTLANTISPKDNYMDDHSTDCWAGDAASRNGSYYFYFSDRKRGIGVMRSNSPKGPFVDVLKKPLVSPRHDPTLFIDNDEQKTPYMVYGDKEQGGFHIARLNDDMMSVAESPKAITITGKEWENAPQWMDKNFLFKRQDTFYLSWGRDYAISNNIEGPYQCVGAVGNGHHLNEFAHGSFFNWKGQFYHIWCYYIKPGFKYRESIMTYCHFDDRNNIVTDTRFLEAHFSNGMGQYHASWSTIEAEWYYEISGNIKKQENQENGFAITNIQNDDWIRFSNVSFDKAYKKSILNLMMNGKKGTLEIRSGSPTGNLLSSFKLIPSKSFITVESPVTSPKSKSDIYLVFKGSAESSLKIDWLKFK